MCARSLEAPADGELRTRHRRHGGAIWFGDSRERLTEATGNDSVGTVVSGAVLLAAERVETRPKAEAVLVSDAGHAVDDTATHQVARNGPPFVLTRREGAFRAISSASQ